MCGSTDHIALDHGDAGTEAGGVTGGHISSGAATDDEESSGHSNRLRRADSDRI
jgi:hypothetical protein